MGTDFTHLLINKNRHVAEVILNRPTKLNTMNHAFFQEIERVFNMIDEDNDVRVAIIWAEGRMFTAGLDLKEAGNILVIGEESRALQAATLFKHIKHLQNTFNSISSCKKPVIAAIHGDCIGGGIDLITACDMRVCSTDAVFSVKETKMAIVADLGTLQRLKKLIGKGPAREMCLTGDPINAVRAKAFNLVNEVFETKEKMLAGARAIATSIAENSPLVVQGTKIVMNFADEHNVKDGLEHVALFNSAFLHSEDLQEAFMSFMQKKKPVFRNNL